MRLRRYREMENFIDKRELEEVEVQETFKVKTLQEANWCFRKMGVLQKKVADKKALVQMEIERLKAWLDEENKKDNNSIEYFEGLLKQYFMETGEKVKTPYGSVTTRKSKKYSYIDAEVLSYLSSNGYNNAIRVKTELDKTEVKKLFKDGINTETGEVIPGMSVKDEVDIIIKVNDDGK